MIVNKYKIVKPDVNKHINIPLEINWDFFGRNDSIEEYQEKMVKEVVGGINDFEILQFSHNQYVNNLNFKKTNINYEFYFYDNASPITSPVTIANWNNSYIDEGFTAEEIYYYTKPFTKSFFKLDLYDTNNEKDQILYLTIILPVQQGFTQSVILSSLLANVDIKIPKFNLDYIGDKEGFYLYWLRKQDYINISEFYMSAKFFDARLGIYVSMTNTPQAIIPNKFIFNPNDYFYYKVILDYTNKTYEVYATSNLTQRVGIDGFPILWYEYVNQ